MSLPRVVPIEEPVLYLDDGRMICNLETDEGRRIYSILLEQMWLRQNGICPLCGRPLARAEATFDHERPRGAGGGWRDDRIEVVQDGKLVKQNAAVHGICNSLKGSRRNVRIVLRYV